MSDITVLLEKVSEGQDLKAQEELLKAVYTELRNMAQIKMAKERPDHTLQPTVLANDVWLKLFPEGKPPHFSSRKHFFGTVGRVMHRMLVDHARKRLALKRGNGRDETDLGDTLAEILANPADDEVIEAVNTALERFAEVDANIVKLVELRFFVGLSMKEAAEVMGVSLRSAERDYAYFTAWFRREFQKEMDAAN